jgi:hypothetical protein
LQTWKARSTALNLIVQTTSPKELSLDPGVTPATTVAGSDARERRLVAAGF